MICATPAVWDYAIEVPAGVEFEQVKMGQDIMTYDDQPVRSDDG